MKAGILAAGLAIGASCAAAQSITGAEFFGETTRYPHGILGDAIEYNGLRIFVTDTDGTRRAIEHDMAGTNLLFEDTVPRLWDIDGQPGPEVVVVLTDVRYGAALAVFGPDGIITQTDPIGRSNRWLAPVGAVDMDGDGHVEVAYVDRPHLAKVLRVLRFRDGALEPVAQIAGVTNHRIGEADIGGGLRLCAGQAPEMIVASADWQRVLGITLGDSGPQVRDIAPHHDRSSFAAAMTCD